MCRTITVFAAVLVLLSSETVRADDDYTDDDDNSPPSFSGDSYKNGGWQFNIKESETGENNQFIGVVEASDVSNCTVCLFTTDRSILHSSSFFFIPLT